MVLPGMVGDLWYSKRRYCSCEADGTNADRLAIASSMAPASSRNIHALKSSAPLRADSTFADSTFADPTFADPTFLNANFVIRPCLTMTHGSRPQTLEFKGAALS